MKKILFLILVFIFIGCESPKKFNWDEFLGEDDTDAVDADMTVDQDQFSDADSINNDIDTVIKDEDVVFDTDVQPDIDQNDMDEFNDSDFDADTDIDNDIDIDTDIVVELFCGDGKVSNGEMCDGNIITCSEAGLTGSTGTVTCNPDCSGWVTYPDKCTKSNQTCTGLPANAEWNTASNITQTWNGIVWIPVTAGSYSTVASTEECKFKCKTNYTWSGSVCIANTKVFICSAKPSTGTVWNTVSSYTQTWTGSAWSPADSTTEYNTAPSTTACRYKCDTNYTWNGSICAGNTKTSSCAGLPSNAEWNTVPSITQTWDGSAWTPLTTGAYNETESTSECRFKCKTNYSWNGSACVAGARTFTCADKPATGTVWNTVSSYSQTWTGSAWNPADSVTAYNTTSSTTACRYKCDTNYNWNGTNCDIIVPETVCTGQTLCFDNTTIMNCPSEGSLYYGQDSQYAALGYCTPKSYTVSGTEGSDVVIDNNTGLQWQRTLPATYSGCSDGIPPGTTCTWQGAINYCDGLSYAGHTDWRLPTRKELATLPDYGKYNPAIDIAVFPGTKSSNYWSSSSFVGSTINAWYVNFSNGSVIADNKADGSYARCVRGAALPASSFAESTVSGEVIVIDNTTGLIWQKKSKISVWIMNYCENSNYAGYEDWRLPNIEELKTLIDDSKYTPSSSFPGISSHALWSSSSNVSITDRAWYVDLGNGAVTYYSKANATYVLCVR